MALGYLFYAYWATSGGQRGPQTSSLPTHRRSLCEIIISTLGMLIHRWIGGTLFRTSITLKSKQRESGASESPCFSQMRSEMRLSMFLQKLRSFLSEETYLASFRNAFVKSTETQMHHSPSVYS